MGCTSTFVIQSRKVVPLPPEIINSYIDKFPAIILLKIKQKFDFFADKQTKDLAITNFEKLYSIAKLTPEMLKRLFVYFNDNHKGNIKFRQFIVKYATIVKCEHNVFCNIMFEMYKNNVDRDLMTEEQFSNFLKSETEHITKSPNLPLFPLSLQKFIEVLSQAEFMVQRYQSKLIITTQEDVPFKQINQQLTNCDFNDFEPQGQYYLLSNAWFYRWSFYYQDADHTLERQQIKSTKVLPNENLFGKRNNKRRESIHQQRKLNDSIRTSQLGNTLVEQPKVIEFDDIEGEYRGQLKQNLKISAQIKIISKNLWKLLCLLHPTQQSFRRKAINIDTLQYYPKAIYYIQTNQKAEFVTSSQAIKLLPLSQKVFSLKNANKGQQSFIFTKNFGQKNWRQVQADQSLAEISTDPRFFIVVTPNRSKFIDKKMRNEMNRQNLQIGDKVYVHFAYVNQSQAYIIGIGEDDTFKVHFKDYSYRYQTLIKRQQISVIEEETSLPPKKKNESIIKGIPNVGNTCFMNSIIQCLIATPVFQNFLVDYPFNQKKQPIGFGLSQIAKSLLKNEKALPHQFKKMIDIHMPLFSGYDQHDAQQFLNVLLDKLNQEITQKPTVIDYLFGGKVQSKLTCTTCSALKNIQEKMYILSLPIPQAEYNYFTIIVVPITSSKLKKLIFKLHKNAVVADYCSAFEERTNMNKKDFLFVETSFNSLKKVKHEIINPLLQKKSITQVGIVPNISLLAFEKLPFQFYYDLLSKKKESQYKDFQPKQQAPWTICKIIETKNEVNQATVEYITPENEIEKVKVDFMELGELTAKLGSKSDVSYKKIILRKFNASLKRLQSFGLQFLAGVPRWASYNDLINIVQKYLDNLRHKQAVRFNVDRKQEKGNYIIRFLDPSKNRCIFCQAEVQMFNIEQKQISHCCDISERDIPINWIAKNKSFWVYVDWIDFSKCNFGFCTFIQIDPISKSVQTSRQDVHINLDSCMKMHSHPEVVEMECDKCKQKYQNLQHLIGCMPNILVVHMKQFRYTSQGHLIKLDLRLKWQEFLDSSKYALGSNGKLYELYALVKHSGNSQSGHYTCMTKRKHPYQNKKVWVNFDDDTTTITKHEQKFIDDAYLLFYKKVDMPTSSLVIYSDLNSH